MTTRYEKNFIDEDTYKKLFLMSRSKANKIIENKFNYRKRLEQKLKDMGFDIVGIEEVVTNDAEPGIYSEPGYYTEYFYRLKLLNTHTKQLQKPIVEKLIKQVYKSANGVYNYFVDDNELWVTSPYSVDWNEAERIRLKQNKEKIKIQKEKLKQKNMLSKIPTTTKIAVKNIKRKLIKYTKQADVDLPDIKISIDTNKNILITADYSYGQEIIDHYIKKDRTNNWKHKETDRSGFYYMYKNIYIRIPLQD